MDSLYDLLAGKNFDEPPEIAAIKQYVRDKFKADVSVTLRDNQLVVGVTSAALASRLRFDMTNLKKNVETDKKIILRIG